MAKIDVPRLVLKKSRNGRGDLCYWNPSKTLRAAGWKPVPLGRDIDAAIAEAKALNAKVEDWRNGVSRPHQVKAFAKRGTISQLIDHYKKNRLGALEPRTQKTYRWALGRIEQWAGSELTEHITRERVRKLRDTLLKPDETGEVRLNRANGILRVLRILMAYAIREGLLPEDAKNPAIEQNVPAPAPRHQIWSPIAMDLFLSACDALGQPSVALAALLGREVGQREGDLLKLSIDKWTTVPRYKLDPRDWDRLAEPEPDGSLTVRAIRVRQGKTKRWVEVPVVGELRRRMNEAVASARADSTTILLRECFNGQRRPWPETRFQNSVAAARRLAESNAGDDALAAEIKDLQFRDLRRTAVVHLGELGIEDHLIAAITAHSLDETKKILETYMPRTTKMAGRAIALRLEREPIPAEPTPIHRAVDQS